MWPYVNADGWGSPETSDKKLSWPFGSQGRQEHEVANEIASYVRNYVTKVGTFDSKDSAILAYDDKSSFHLFRSPVIPALSRSTTLGAE